jgi:ribosome biogenesis protein Nip4
MPLCQGANNNQHGSAKTNADIKMTNTEATETLHHSRSILGPNVEPNVGFQETVKETEEMAKKRKTMIWIENFPEYAYTDNTKTALLRIVKLMEEQRQERKSFHHKNTHDLGLHANQAHGSNKLVSTNCNNPVLVLLAIY